MTKIATAANIVVLHQSTVRARPGKRWEQSGNRFNQFGLLDLTRGGKGLIQRAPRSTGSYKPSKPSAKPFWPWLAPKWRLTPRIEHFCGRKCRKDVAKCPTTPENDEHVVLGTNFRSKSVILVNQTHHVVKLTSHSIRLSFSASFWVLLVIFG